LVAIGVSFVNQIACEGQPLNDNVVPTKSQQIWGDRVISQSFVAPRPGLNRIDILFETYGRQNQGEVTLRLLEVPEQRDNPLLGTERFRTAFDAGSLWDQSWRPFTFPSLANSAGKTYLISLSSAQSSDGNAITVGGIQENVYLPGTAYFGAVPVEADIAFRTCYQLTNLEKLGVLAAGLTRNKPTMWGDTVFYSLLLLLYALLLWGLFWQLTRLVLERPCRKREDN
jgi:hypothetical protein